MNCRRLLGIGLIIFAAALFMSAPGKALAWNLKVSCAGTPATATTGTPITFTATQTSTLLPSQGHYGWIWSGTDGLTGSTQSVVKSYSSAGTKIATVQVVIILNSGEIIDSVTESCSVIITTPPPPPATLKIIKTVLNNNGGVKTAADFSMHVKSGTTDVTGSPAAGSSSGTTYTLPAGTYTVSEDAVSGYTQTGISGDCSSSGSVTLASGDSKTCTVTNDDNPSGGELGGACAVSPSTGVIGSLFSWSASATGGTGTYTYLWSGDESLSATSDTVTKSYASSGTKTGTVVITSGSQSVTRSCTVTVTTTTGGGFDGVCSVSPSTVSVGDTVHWGASGSGGTGTYTYSWSGTDGLSGATDALAKIYSSPGIKSGTVEITSGSNAVTKTCSVTVNPLPNCSSGCGGGFNQPNVVLFKKATTSPFASASLYLGQIPYSPATTSKSAVYLSQIPYTGVVADNVKSFVYIILLLALSGFVTYYISRRRSGDKRLFKDTIQLVNITGEATRNYSANEARVPHFENTIDETRQNNLATKERNTIQSVAVPAKAQQTENAQERDTPPFVIVPAASEAKQSEIPIETGTIHLANLVDTMGETKRNNSAADENEVSEFLAWLALGDSRRVFDYLRSPNRQGKDVGQLVTALASELDLVYRSRIDKNITALPERTKKLVANWDNKKIEEVISILVGAVDESYESNYTPIRLAMIRIMKMKP